MTLIIVMFQQVNSQTITWQRAYDINNSPDAGFDVVETFDSNYVICGYAGDDLLLMKLNKFGLTQWVRLISTSDYFRGSAFEQTPDSGFIITGDVSGDSVLLLKTNKEGSVEWKKTFTNPGGFAWGNSVKITNDNGYIICADIIYKATFTLKGYILKTDNEGNLQWSREYDSLYGGDIFQTPDTNYYYASGSSIRKLNSIGKVLWEKNLGLTIPNISRLSISKMIHKNDFIYVSGGLSLNGGFDFNMYMGKIDLSGNVQWEKNFLSNASASGLCITLSGKLLLVGTVFDNSSNPVVNVAVINVNQDGVINYVKRINAKTKVDGEGYAIAITNDNGYIISGLTEYEGTVLNTNVLVIKCDSLGNTSPIVKIKNDQKILPSHISLFQNFPNPFNPRTNIHFKINKRVENIKLIIHNILGKELIRIDFSDLNSGDYSYIFDGENLSSGIYYYTLVANDIKMTKKMIFLK